MINVLPTPKFYEFQSEDYHALPMSLHTDVKEWSDIAEAFCDSFYKIYEQELTITAPAGILLVYDGEIAPNAYALDSTDRLIIRASAREGICYGIATALQLMKVDGTELSVQSVCIKDHPDKDFRAFMIDVGFRWHPFDKMLKYVDLCFFYKINHLHLHIADNNIYSLPSKAFPGLPTPRKHYTFEQIAQLNRYAEARGIKLVPEFECPGHAKAMNTAYPEIFMNRAETESGEFYNELGSKIDPLGLVCAGSERAFEGVKTILAEIAELFPNAPYIHIGGDEAPHQMWEQCQECRAYMKAHGIKDSNELYSEFVGRVASYVLSLGKTPMVWEGFPKESAHYVPKETVVIAWESHYQLATDLLENGFRIINASWQPTYLVSSLDKRWGPKELLDWNVYNWQHWWSSSAAYLSPINVQPTDRLLGATMCSWALNYEQHIGRLLENFPAFGQRTWQVERALDYETYKQIFRTVLIKGAALIQDK